MKVCILLVLITYLKTFFVLLPLPFPRPMPQKLKNHGITSRSLTAEALCRSCVWYYALSALRSLYSRCVTHCISLHTVTLGWPVQFDKLCRMRGLINPLTQEVKSKYLVGVAKDQNLNQICIRKPLNAIPWT
jgi:hypothetical protein